MGPVTSNMTDSVVGRIASIVWLFDWLFDAGWKRIVEGTENSAKSNSQPTNKPN